MEMAVDSILILKTSSGACVHVPVGDSAAPGDILSFALPYATLAARRRPHAATQHCSRARFSRDAVRSGVLRQEATSALSCADVTDLVSGRIIVTAGTEAAEVDFEL